MSLYARAAGIVGSLGLCLMITGCAADRHEDIPKGTPMVAKGEKELIWQAPASGDVFVYDQTEGTMLYSGRVQRGDTLDIDAMDDRILLDGRTVMDKQIRDHNEIEVFFRRNPMADQARPAGESNQGRQSGQSNSQQPQVENRIIVEQPENRRDADDSRIDVERDQGRQGDGNRVIVEPGRDGDTTIRVR